MADDYWREAVESSLEEAGVTATAEQIEAVARDMEAGHEQYDMAYGGQAEASKNWNSIQDSTIEALRCELRDERDKQTCKTCRGTGYSTIRVRGRLCHDADFECHKCHGNGRRTGG